jgi:tetratricopeptide (TPR) repeat protein
VARGYVNLGLVLAAAGKAREAEECYLQAVKLKERLVEGMAESAVPRADLARTLARLADLYKDPSRRSEAEAIRRRMVRLYEALTADFAEDPRHRRYLVRSYLKLVSLLWEAGRPAEAAEPYRKALDLDPMDADINNELAWFLATNPEPGLRDAALAVRLAKKAVAALPKSADCRNTLGVAHYRNGDVRAVVAELEAAMSLRGGGDSFDWFFLAMAHWRLGNRDQARVWFNRAVEWMQRHRPHDDELCCFRAEAEAMLAEAPALP